DPGVLAASLDDAQITATADVRITGQAVRALDPASISAAAGGHIAAGLGLTLDDATLSASGGVFSVLTATLAIALGPATLSAAAFPVTIGGPAVVPAPPQKLGGDRIQDRVWRGYAKAAQHLGSWHDIYRPRGAKNPLAGVNRWGKIAVSLDAKPYKFDAPNLYGKPVWYALLDGGLVQVGDYLINQKTL